MKALQDFTRRFPLVMAVVMLVFTYCAIQYIPEPESWGNWGSAIREAGLAIVSVIIAILFVRPAVFHASAKGFKYAFKKSIYYIIINIVIIGLLFAVVTFIYAMDQGKNLEFVQSFLAALLISASVGVFEEVVFRTFVFGGLIAALGRTRAGVFAAAIISALIFGFIHVMNVLFGGDPLTVETIGQIVGKTLQTGIVGFFLAAIYLKTHNIWFIALLHGLGDFFGIWASYAGAGSQIGNYAGQGSMGMYFYVFMIVVNIPVVIIAVKMLLSVEPPQLGPLADDNFVPCIPQDTKKKKMARAAK